MTTIRYTLQRDSIPFSELVERYGDLSLAEFVDLAIENGMIPLQPVLVPIDPLKEHPQRAVIFPLSSCQNGLAS